MWPQLLSFAVGVWVMASPGILAMGDRPSTIAWVVGPTVASVAAVAAFEVLRGVRFGNVFLGLVLVTSPLLGDYDTPALVSAVVSGLALVVLALPGGRPKQHYAGGWKALSR